MFGTQSIAKCMDRLSTNIHGHHVGAILFIHLTSYSFCMYIQLNYSNMLACLLAHLPACLFPLIHSFVHSFIHSFIHLWYYSEWKERGGKFVMAKKRWRSVFEKCGFDWIFSFFFFIHTVLGDKNKWEIEEKGRGKRHFEKKGEREEKLSWQKSLVKIVRKVTAKVYDNYYYEL